MCTKCNSVFNIDTSIILGSCRVRREIVAQQLERLHGEMNRNSGICTLLNHCRCIMPSVLQPVLPPASAKTTHSHPHTGSSVYTRIIYYINPQITFYTVDCSVVNILSG